MTLSNYEKETIINFNEEEQTASVYTFNGALKRKLARLSEERPEECKLDQQHSTGAVEYLIPKKWVKVNAPPVLTEEQREKKRALIMQRLGKA